MKISEDKVVELTYELEVDGQVVDYTTEEKPLDFIFGYGQLLQKFEEYIDGLEAGDKFKFTLDPDDGYGQVDQNRIIELPKEVFSVNGEIREDLLVPGNVIQMMNNMGAIIPGKVVEVGDDAVTMDLNHPMAGKTLNFSGVIVSVREATKKELEEGLHGEYLQHGCSGCSSQGGCGGSCNDSEHECGSEGHGCGCN